MKRPLCLQGNWTPARARIARKVAEFPAEDGRRKPNSAGQEFDESRIAFELRVSKQMVSMFHQALLHGAIIPSDEEIAAVEATGGSIPLDPNDKRQTTIIGKPLEAKPETIVPKAETPAAKIETPASPPEVTPPPAATPPEEKTELSRFDMQAAADKIALEAEKNRMDKPFPDIPVNKGFREPPIPDKPLSPVIKNQEELTARLKAREVAREEALAKEREEAAQAEAAAKAELTKKEDAKKMVIGGDLFKSIQKIGLDLGSVIWFFYVKNVYGYPGDISDFVNWCIADVAKSRGLSLDIVENPVQLIGEGIKYQEEIRNQGDDDGKRTG